MLIFSISISLMFFIRITIHLYVCPFHATPPHFGCKYGTFTPLHFMDERYLQILIINYFKVLILKYIE